MITSKFQKGQPCFPSGHYQLLHAFQNAQNELYEKRLKLLKVLAVIKELKQVLTFFLSGIASGLKIETPNELPELLAPAINCVIKALRRHHI